MMATDVWSLLTWFPLAASFFGPQKELPSITDFMKPGGRPRIIAHRGFSGRSPEDQISLFVIPNSEHEMDIADLKAFLTRKHFSYALVPS